MKMISLLTIVLFLTACNNSSNDNGKSGPAKAEVFTADIAMDLNTFTLRSSALLNLVSTSISGDSTISASAPLEIRENCTAFTSIVTAEGISMAKTQTLAGDKCPVNSTQTRYYLNHWHDVNATWSDTILVKDSNYQKKYGIVSVNNKTKLEFTIMPAENVAYIDSQVSEATFTLSNGDTALLTKTATYHSGADSMSKTSLALVYRANEIKAEAFWTASNVSGEWTKFYFNGNEILKEEFNSTGINRLWSISY